MATNVHPSLFILLRSLQACSDPKSRPGFMTDKALESAIKYIVRKFPLTDAKVSGLWHSNLSCIYCLYVADFWLSGLRFAFILPERKSS